MTERQERLYIFKLAAAQRQLDAAIRMVFAKEDDLAIYTVAAAAYNVLHDMLVKRGRSSVSDNLRSGVRGMANSLVEGTLPKSMIKELQGTDIWTVITRLAEQIRREGTDDIGVNVSTDFERTYLQKFRSPANFLKHADRDPEALMAASAFDVGAGSQEPHSCGRSLSELQMTDGAVLLWRKSLLLRPR